MSKDDVSRRGAWAWLGLALAFVALGAPAATSPPPSWRDGDIVFQTSTSSQSEAIRRATGSKYTHVGVIFLEKGKPVVFEAVGPVKTTAFDAWIRQGVGGRYVVKRLAKANSYLDSEGASRLRKAVERYRGLPYDYYFEWSDEKIYCSELVWKAYKTALGIEIGSPQRLGDFNLSDPVVAAKLKERFGNAVPRDEMVISPGSMFESARLTTVYER